MWYAPLVGQCWPLSRIDKDGYWCYEPAGYINIVRFGDARMATNSEIAQHLAAP
jgi:hypothetical protein